MIELKRFHLFEFEDQRWFPSVLRNIITDYLKYMIEVLNVYDPITEKIKELLIKAGHNQVIDLCSGSGGPMIRIQQNLKKEGIPLKVLLTDKFPIKKIVNPIHTDDVVWINESVDAMSVPSHLKGVRTSFTSFHHFKPEGAIKLLQDAVQNNSAIGVFEFTERTVFNLIFAPIFIPLAFIILNLFIKPFSVKRIFWSYIIPIAPLLCFWDGWVSNLRTYTVKELNNMVGTIKDNEKFIWDIGKVKSKWCNITYLVGYPRAIKRDKNA